MKENSCNNKCWNYNNPNYNEPKCCIKNNVNSFPDFFSDCGDLLAPYSAELPTCINNLVFFFFLNKYNKFLHPMK